jgi:hypothetical protein
MNLLAQQDSHCILKLHTRIAVDQTRIAEIHLGGLEQGPGNKGR